MKYKHTNTVSSIGLHCFYIISYFLRSNMIYCGYVLNVTCSFFIAFFVLGFSAAFRFGVTLLLHKVSFDVCFALVVIVLIFFITLSNLKEMVNYTSTATVVIWYYRISSSRISSICIINEWMRLCHS